MKHHADLEALIERCCNGTSSAEENAKLGALLRAEPGALDEYIRRVDLHASLAVGDGQFLSSTAAPSPWREEAGSAAIPRIPRWWARAAVVAGIASVAALLLLAPHRPRSAQIAVLSASNDAQWADPKMGARLLRGDLPTVSLQLVSGLAEFTFENGATVIFEGPAEFKPLDAGRLLLTRGKVFCRCPDKRSRITVITPETEVVDLGTEFIVETGGGANTSVGVIRGEVALPKRARPLRLTAGQAIDVISNEVTRSVPLQLDHFSPLVFLDGPKIKTMKHEENLLLDPGFESGVATGSRPAGEIRWEATAGFTESAAGRGRGGSSAVHIFARGNPEFPLAEQTIDTRRIAGRLVIGSAWCTTPREDPICDRQCAILKLNFVDKDGREFASAERCFSPESENPDQFVEADLAAIIPQETVWLRFQVLLRASGIQSGSILFDDASLTVSDAAGSARPRQ